MDRLKMPGAVFLSASVPDPIRGPSYARTADTVAITSAVTSLLHVLLGRRRLVWGGHPAITPIVWAVAEGLKIDYGKWVTLYQSLHFKDEFPEDNRRFENVVYTDDVDGDREKSLLAMRRTMFEKNEFEAAVFIGGMGGIIEEFRLFQQQQPAAQIVPVLSTGGATLSLAQAGSSVGRDLMFDLDYVALFHRHLSIPTSELRYPTPDGQPEIEMDRMWVNPQNSDIEDDPTAASDLPPSSPFKLR